MRLTLTFLLLTSPAFADEPERTPIFCDQYARHAAGTPGTVQGGRTGNWAGAAAGATQGGKTSRQRGALIGGTIGAAKGGQWDKQVIDFFYEECISGHKLSAPFP
ncbi:glycine zipper domain-containing protein [Shimia gijangensis]|uniref:glycine zipper domain-containing protein n=1 Tax=Shimia gijangensis TaxID=1470563 RepID=UPI00093409F1|nr:glycine zipper domain-containing protein [Shimia gijangensis]